MIGVYRNKFRKRALIIDSYVDVDSNVDLLADFFDFIFIKSDVPKHAAGMLIGASPVLTCKCSYKPVFMSKNLQGRMDLADNIVDGYFDDMDSEQLMDIVNSISENCTRYGIKSETTRPTTPNHLFSNILRYHLSRGETIISFKLIEKSSLGYVNPVFEHYHSLGLYHLRERFAFDQALLDLGAIKINRYVTKEHLCPKCNHSHIIYTENCPKCGSADLRIENIIHHFRCANVSSEATYNIGGMLVCPKCRRQLRHIGVDYDRPATVFTCNDCGDTFSLPRTNATCCNCESTVDVKNLVPHDVRFFEITHEGIRLLSSGGEIFSQLAGMHDNYLDYSSLVNRLRQQLTEYYATEDVTAMIGKIWILNDKNATERITEVIQSSLCRRLLQHKVSYNNNIFYVGSIYVDKRDAGKDQIFVDELSKVIRKICREIEPEQHICFSVDVLDSKEQVKIEEFIHNMNYISAAPYEVCNHSGERIATEVVVSDSVEPFVSRDIEREENDLRIRRRYTKILLWISTVLLILSALAILILT